MTHRVEDLAVWSVQLPSVEHAILPPSTNRPNPSIAGDRLFVSVFAPGAICALESMTGDLIWRRELRALAGERSL